MKNLIKHLSRELDHVVWLSLAQIKKETLFVVCLSTAFIFLINGLNFLLQSFFNILVSL